MAARAAGREGEPMLRAKVVTFASTTTAGMLHARRSL